VKAIILMNRNNSNFRNILVDELYRYVFKKPDMTETIYQDTRKYLSEYTNMNEKEIDDVIKLTKLFVNIKSK
jgi:hypothetical protein